MSSRPILVLGCGSIGRRHSTNLQKLGYPVIAFDPDRKRRVWMEKNLGCATVETARAGFKRRPRAAWICAPPAHHSDIAREAISLGIPCFIEKPLAVSLSAAESVRILSRKHHVPVAVGYQLRFHPGLQWLKKQIDSSRWGRLLFIRAEFGQYLPDWRPWQNYKTNYTAVRNLGGGILLDGSHEIDLLRWLAGEVESVYCAASRLSRLKIDVEDTAALVLRFKSKALGEIHIDMVQRAYRRSLEAVFEDGTILWDFPTAIMRVYSASTKRWQTRSFAVDLNALYVRETQTFLSHLITPAKAGVQSMNGLGPGFRRGDKFNSFPSATEGARTLAVVEAAQKSAKTKKMEKVR